MSSLTFEDAEPNVYPVHKVVVGVNHGFSRVQWTVREGCRVQQGQLLGLLTEFDSDKRLKSPAMIQDASKHDGANGSENNSDSHVDATPVCRIISPATGRIVDRQPLVSDRWSSCTVVEKPDDSAQASVHIHRVGKMRCAECDDLQSEKLSLTTTISIIVPNACGTRTFRDTVAVGDVVLCRVIEEPCQHSVVIEGLCTDCGLIVVKGGTDNAVASFFENCYTRKLGFLSPSTDFSISAETAKQLEFEKVSLLLKQKKLPLILDLDNTLLHAYPLPPPPDINDILKDPEFRVVQHDDPSLRVKPSAASATRCSDDGVTVNGDEPKGGASDPQSFPVPHYLPSFDSPEVQAIVRCWESWVISIGSVESSGPSRRSKPTDARYYDSYVRPYTCYYKLRPGVLRFLREASEKFELYLFTAGTSLHAISSLQVLDPERRWFGSRVFTREDLPQLEGGALGLKTIQRIFPGEAATQNLVTVVDDCESVWSPDSNIFKVHAYHWWPDPSLHPFLLLYCRRTPNGAGTHSEVPVKMVDPSAFSRIRAAAFAMLNFCPSIIQMCQSPRRVAPPIAPHLLSDVPTFYPVTSLDGGHSTPTSSSSLFVPSLTTVTTSNYLDPKPPSEAPDAGQLNVAIAFEAEREDAAQLPLLLKPSVETDTHPHANDQLGYDNADTEANGKIEVAANSFAASDSHQENVDQVSQLTAGSLTEDKDDERFVPPLPPPTDSTVPMSRRKRLRASDSPVTSAPTAETNDGVERDIDNNSVTPGSLPLQATVSAVEKKLRSVQSYLAHNFDRLRQGETQDELNARVLQTTTENWTAPEMVKDNDRQLEYLLSILCAMREEFFRQAGEIDFDNLQLDQLPSVKCILDSMRQTVLQNVVLKTTGIREAAIPNFHDTDLGRSVKDLGGQLVPHRTEKKITHLLVGKETEFYVNARKNETFPYSAHLMWLEAALFTFQRYDESFFTVDHCEKRYRVFWDALASHADASKNFTVPTKSSAEAAAFEKTKNDNTDKTKNTDHYHPEVTHSIAPEDETLCTAKIPAVEQHSEILTNSDITALENDLLDAFQN